MSGWRELRLPIESGPGQEKFFLALIKQEAAEFVVFGQPIKVYIRRVESSGSTNVDFEGHVAILGLGKLCTIISLNTEREDKLKTIQYYKGQYDFINCIGEMTFLFLDL